MCVGEYNEHSDDARTHVSCSAYTAPTLACIAEGISELVEFPAGGVRGGDMACCWGIGGSGSPGAPASLAETGFFKL
jgi:hypothetical protein